MTGERILNLIIEKSEELNQYIEAMKALDNITITYNKEKMRKRFHESQAFLSIATCQKLIEFSEAIGEMLRKDNG